MAVTVLTMATMLVVSLLECGGCGVGVVKGAGEDRGVLLVVVVTRVMDVVLATSSLAVCVVEGNMTEVVPSGIPVSVNRFFITHAIY